MDVDPVVVVDLEDQRDLTREVRRARLEERHHQVVLARFQNKQHIGQKIERA